MHFARLGKVIQHVCPVKTGHPGLHADKIGGGAVGISGEDLGIVPDHVKIDIGQHADAVTAANDIKDGLDGGIGKSRHQVLSPFFRVFADVLLRGQRMRHFHHLKAELLFHAALSQFIAPADVRTSGSTPGQTDGGHLVARFQVLWLMKMQHKTPSLSLDFSMVLAEIQ